ncbi:YSIRK-type signal peptide-containing protein [Lactobacillus rodentium]|uniref:LPXTG cell wall anchor domain-containing protein n=1 Tax=Lactobacillus rodentium TaxID=947835 RepID=UPI00214B1132|nr:YSIRK-type signal peptide-containing protein [Lactobacillus rodentium]MCR1894967.1 YSIRK-type signal peptide-containing protein [Lactobacillus rodentium]
MLSKNNFQERLRKMEQKNEHFSIRKLTVGAASVLIGLTFLGFSGHTVHADTTDASGVTYTKYQPEQKPEPHHQPVDPSKQPTGISFPDLPSGVNTVYYGGDENTTPANQSTPASDETKDASGVTYTKYQPESKPEPEHEKVAPNPVQGITNPNPPQPGRVNWGTSDNDTTETTKPAAPTVTTTYNDDNTEQTPENVTYTKAPSEKPVDKETSNVSELVYQEFSVNMPNSQDRFYKFTNKNEMSGKKDSEGNYTWDPISFDEQSLSSVLAGNNFINSGTGKSVNSLPTLDGYKAKIDSVVVSPDDRDADKAASSKLLLELQNEIEANPYQIPAYTVDYPLNVSFHIIYERTNTPLKQDTFQELDVYLPNERDVQYYKHFDTVTLTGEKDANGKESWNSSSYQAHSLSSLLAGNDFISANTASDNNALPTMKGYTPKIVKAYLVNAPSDNPTVSGLLDELDAKIAENPYEVPAYTIPAGLSTPLRVGFDVVYEANSTSGTPLTQDDKPAYEGGVSGTPLTQDDKPAFNGGVAGIPLTQDDKPAFNGGVAGIPLTQDDKPAFNGGVSGTPLTQDDKPAFNGGVSGIPETQPDLPVAPLPEEPETPTTPTDNNNVPGQPVDTNEGTVAPHPTDNPDNGDNSVETPVVHATEAVKADNTDNGVTAPVHAAAVAHNDEKKANTLPQTGAKATPAGVLGLMLASVGAIFGLAATKKRKN